MACMTGSWGNAAGLGAPRGEAGEQHDSIFLPSIFLPPGFMCCRPQLLFVDYFPESFINSSANALPISAKVLAQPR